MDQDRLPSFHSLFFQNLFWKQFRELPPSYTENSDSEILQEAPSGSDLRE